MWSAAAVVAEPGIGSNTSTAPTRPTAAAPPRRSPLILHLGCVAHQGAKWQIPPEHWTCTPDAVSAHGAWLPACCAVLPVLAE